MSDYSEDALIEQPAIQLFHEIGWSTIDCYQEAMGAAGTLGRKSRQEVVLTRRLRESLAILNPETPNEALDSAVEIITRDRSAMIPVRANHEVYQLLRDGVKVEYRDEHEERVTTTLKVIDWNDPSKNDYLLTSQLWVTGEVYKRRTDLIGFVNGIPLVFIELKANHKQLKDAYNDNLRDYKNTIPQLFWYNALIILSNGRQSKIGSMTANWEHFADWTKINSEGETGVVSLETILRGTCAPDKLGDLVENFILYSEESGGLVKLVAKNHQFLGVNNAFEAVKAIKANQGKLGVFWHTQGSGKTYSMAFFAQKVLRKLIGNHTFVIVTDRTELDDQIYKNFATVGAVTESEERVRAGSGEQLKRFLKEDHRYLFTLIQKFHVENGQTYPMLSDRSDIIVMTDEAHRSQYDIFAQNMRNALPEAAFIGFTGTPLLSGEELTKSVFGDYVSVYNFQQSVEDGATVPLYYENRIPELQLTNDDLNEDMEALLDDAVLDEAQERKLEKEFSREYHLLTRDERLNTIADDIVSHFMGRGFEGKAMMISVDKVTAARMYHKVRGYWESRLNALRAKLKTVPKEERTALEAEIAYMAETDMALIVSQSQNEVEDMAKKGIDIMPHRLRMQKEDLATKFKNPNDPLRIVFVCAMWITGFDVPSCSTVYLDKPMKNHTLMQTIARANRVFPNKSNGLIVDYVGVFRNLQKALAMYGASKAKSSAFEGDEDSPVADKSQLVAALAELIDETNKFCSSIGVDTAAIQLAQGFNRVNLINSAVELIITTKEHKLKFLSMASAVDRTFRAILPDASVNDHGPARTLFVKLADTIRVNDDPDANITDILTQVDALLDDSVEAESYLIKERPAGMKRYDLSKIDVDKLRARFEQGQKHTQTQKLQAILKKELDRLVAMNKTRMDYMEKFQAMIAEYNTGSQNADEQFQMLLDFMDGLTKEATRHISENLTEEELAIFDLLMKPSIDMSENEVKQIKKTAKDLLETLKREKLVLDWRKRQQSRAGVKLTIESVLDQLPEAFTADMYNLKCEQVYQHVYESYYGEGRSAYAAYA
ncbi:DEAD/DEAH box helicase [Capsulimonas corticalis]|uniref:Type I restriction enzyme endonuclease subunit n=1 Tax=Capsulimonas corticalis TaxID=2219043 RepID=A0A402CW07_9BACT|nr:type I restriction endonuclease subunit R [Capsulimonas corticalis]BDI33997.1 DEAD/DEAH box helicase [Capsulimonas corticalis]